MAWLHLSDGVPLWYEERGEGPVVVLVPGWTFTTRFYDDQVADLSRDHRVVTFDLRGAGSSGKTPEGHSLGQYASDLLELCIQLELTDVTLVAWAMGVSVSLHAITKDPAPFAGFVWCDHSPRFYAGPDWPFGLGGDLDPWAWDQQVRDLQADRGAASRDLIRSCFHEAPSESRVNELAAELMRTPTEVMTIMATALANIDLRTMLHHLKLPVLLINGRHSIVPCAVADWVTEQVPTARSVVFENSGHLPYLEEPDRFNAEVRSFAASVLP